MEHDARQQVTIEQLVSLQGRACVVVGGASGIGRAVCRRLAEAGGHVLVGDMNKAGAEATASELVASGLLADAAMVDVTDSESVDALAAVAEERFGGVDVWVNNVGIFPEMPAVMMSDVDWHHVIQTNLTGAFYGCRAAARLMEGRGGAVIINMSSVAAYRVRSVGLVHYTASKHGIIGLTRSMAVELGPVGVRVLAVAPTITRTEGILSKLAEAGKGDVERSLARRGSQLPLGRVADPDDVARVVLFCASDMSEFLTGCCIPVDGGEVA